MASNKFATMLRRSTNRMTFVLIYAALEWILIILLLLNSLFSYLIIKFSDYFGLKRPCLWCSRLDDIIEPGKNKSSYRDLVCEAHASEISGLSYCRNHEKLAESQDMCEDCSSSSQSYFTKLSGNFSFYQWMKQIGIFQVEKAVENCDESIVCSCCGVELDRRLLPPCNMFKNSWGDLDFTPEKNLTEDAGVSKEIGEGDNWDQRTSDSVIDHHIDDESTEEIRGSQSLIVSDVGGGSWIKTEEAEGSCACSVCDDGKEMTADGSHKAEIDTEKEKDLKVHMNEDFCDQIMSLAVRTQDICEEVLPQHLEFYIDQDDCQLIPVELISSTSCNDENQHGHDVKEEGNGGNEDVILDFDMNFESENWHNSKNATFFCAPENKEPSNFIAVEQTPESKEEQVSTDNPGIQHVSQQRELPVNEDYLDRQKDLAGRREVINSVSHQASEEVKQIQNDDFEPEVSIGSEIPEHGQEGEDDRIHNIIPDSHQDVEECPDKTTFKSPNENDNEGFFEFPITPVKTSIHSLNDHLSSCMELNENEEDKVAETPNSVEGFHQLHKKLLLLDRKESGTEESLDGSVTSDIDGGSEVTVDKLKSALRAERKALHALYAELEEERSASAVATNQTMAMINRLQEEKAAMQMEALQYQRMMEEQSEYDQEALQLLNELMVKKDKEKQELEKELDMYRKMVQEYEEKGRMGMLRRDGCTRSRTSSISYSNPEDSDGLSVDLNHEAKEESNVESLQESSSQNTPEDAVLYMEESLAKFEEERLSILEQLKVLEGRLFILNEEEEEERFVEIQSIGNFHEENGNGYHVNFDSRSEVNGYANGHAKENNGKNYQERKATGAKAKRLLPLFDAVEEEEEDGVFINGDENGIDVPSHSFGKVQMQKNRLTLEEEVDHVYERLQALEADREFLKHCISSLNKGHKGLHLLQEILQHLRDLRNVELRFQNIGDGPL